MASDQSMKAKIASVLGQAESDEIAADITILAQLSTLHVAQARLARERDALIATLASRPRAVEQLPADLEGIASDLRPRDRQKKVLAITGPSPAASMRGKWPLTVRELTSMCRPPISHCASEP